MATNEFAKEVSKRSGWSIFLGILTAVVGAVMIFYPLMTATLSTVFLGWGLLVAGIAQFLFAFDSDGPGTFFVKILLGVLYGLAGMALVAFPIEGVVTLTVLLGSMLVAEGVMEMILAFQIPAGSGRGWLVFNSLVSLLLGVLILAEWPASTGWAIGTLVGTAVLINGITRVVISATIRGDFRKAQGFFKAA